ncbi:hypothetical protein M011DRAFT_9655 [Sporormia fimetaria CBS 119925]|uniref:Uncharacterized protein n=1 Tax=Sporormia fimetaria CBS 119925 TaxID=1340428 RepID=A0A6A6VP23_9PLEO|nr:hypothetical protein M011DRAFT_9655 [Sporormia fimetaria CBS 119925]
MLPPPPPPPRVPAKPTDSALSRVPSVTGRPRPRSLYQFDTRSEQRQAGTVTATSRIARHPSGVEKASATPPVDVGRSFSLRKPAVPTQGTSSATRAHSRTQSTYTASSTSAITERPRPAQNRPRSLFVPDTSSMSSIVETPTSSARNSSRDIPSTTGEVAQRPRTARERPRSVFIPDTSSIRSVPESPTTKADSSRPSTSTRATRSASIRTKPESTHPPPTTTATSRPRTTSDTQTLTRNETTHQVTRRPLPPRPAFSTLQQHFTPRKAPKAPTSVFLHPQPPSSDTDTIPPDLAALQAELLQLHLLHAASGPTNRAWEASAKRHLHAKFNDVVARHKTVHAAALREEEHKNLSVLSSWWGVELTGKDLNTGIAGYIRILCDLVSEVPALVEPDGRFARLVAVFERWIDEIQRIWSKRQIGEEEKGNTTFLPIPTLPKSWNPEAAALMRKLSAFQRDMDLLGVPPEQGSSVEVVLGRCGELVRGMLEELGVMRGLVGEVEKREREWVEEGLRRIASGGGKGGMGLLGFVDGGEEEECVWRM